MWFPFVDNWALLLTTLLCVKLHFYQTLSFLVNVTIQTDGQKLIPGSMFFSKKTNKKKITLFHLVDGVPPSYRIQTPQLRSHFWYSPLLSILCSCILICIILPKNRLITAKQLHRIIIAFVTVILVRQRWIQRGY